MDEQIKELFETTDLRYEDIAERVGASYKMVWSRINRWYSKDVIRNRKVQNYRKSKTGAKNPYYGMRGEDSPHWTGGVVSDGKGYLMTRKPDWYTGRKGSKYVFTHVLVVCEALGLTELPAGWNVHHIDGDKTNNDLSNLALVTMSAHQRIHAQLERATTIPKGSRGRYAPKRTATVAA